MICVICGESTTLIQRGTLITMNRQDTGILHGGKVYCQPCIEVLVAKYAESHRLGSQDPPPVPDGSPPAIPMEAAA